ncbi:VCBS repeat-containing protein [Actinoplanes bogorensis]|uniref:VCBS repeat-containing protein n=1 Tax=Paractinoplanes bogorensis TaxID=1610840 RepID=A0ABS5YWE5_9ACTN|nr:VCBS repeat-containing protein [Actinoplanes bogorensis]MBU2667767.1 VCBS repeat-containing protein [Actinoplanes bogorensis]
MYTTSRRAVAAVISGLFLSVGASVTPAEAATAPSEVKVIPADRSPVILAQRLVFAGETGVLHQHTATSPWLWTPYATGRTTIVEGITGVSSSAVIPAGGDTVEFTTAVPGHDFSVTTRAALDLSTMTWRQHSLPGSGYVTRLLGDFRVVLRNTSTPVREVWSLGADGSHEATPITGVPEDTSAISVRAGDADAAVLSLTGPTDDRLGLLDLRTGRVELLAGTDGTGTARLSSDRIGIFLGATVRTWSRSAVLAGRNPEPTVLTLPSTPSTVSVGLAGDDVIVAPSVSMTGRAPVLRYSPGGGQPTPVVPLGDFWTAQGPDGVLLTGGDGAGTWSIRQATEGGQSVVTSLDRPASTLGVTLLAGRLRHLQAYPASGETNNPESRVFTHSVTGPAEPTPDTGALPANLLPCQTGAACARTVDGYQTGTVYLAGDDGSITVRSLPNGGSLENLPSAGGSIADVSSSWILVNGTSPAKLYIVGIGNTPTITRPATGAALVGNIMWSANRAGFLRAEDLSKGTVGLEVPTGSNCTATEVQATARHLYWACGASGPAGVYDKVRKLNIAVPPAQYLLGDNYVVRHDATGALIRHDLTDGVLGAATTMATFPRGSLADDRHITWAVDKLGGDVAWVDESDDVHIVDPGVTPSPPAATATRIQESLYYGDGIGWSGSMDLNQPVDSSTTTITEVRTGQVVATTDNGFSRSAVYASWNGLVGGKRVTSGTYRVSVTGTAGGVTATLGSGTFWVMCGVTRLHSPECHGAPAVLGTLDTPTRLEGHWLISQPSKTTLWDQGSTEDWTGATAIVPYGDITQDFMNDLLVRRSDGTMRSYRGIGQSHYGTSTAVLVPGNWNPYNVLIHTGDVTGDGLADLIARNRETGVLSIFPGDGKGGFSAARTIAGGYLGYSRFVGSGDINGDGKADLMMQYDPTSTMYAKYGNGDGTFQDRVVVGTGWLGYNVVLGAGDLNEDGKNDLIMRDTAGNLYRRLGTGAGTFGDRQLIGSGYQKYAGLY